MISDIKYLTTIKNYRDTLIIEEIGIWSMAHKCDRESCPTANVNGPKSTCIHCKKTCYLLCYGAEKSSTGMVRFRLQNDLTIYVEVMDAKFVCIECVKAGNVAVQAMQCKQKSEIGEITNVQLMEALKVGFVDLKEHINANVEKNQTDVKECMREITETVKKNSRPNEAKSDSSNKPLYSSVLRSKRKVLFTTPISTKRKRPDDNDDGTDGGEKKTSKPIKLPVPKPMSGRSEAVIGQKPKPKEQKQMMQRKSYEKSLRVAGLDPSVTVDELCDYIVKNTSLNDKSKFNCTMLVKKGQDLSTFTYISAKVDVTNEDFDRLMNMDLWPNYVTVREFIRMDKRNERQNGTNEPNPNKLQRRNDVEVNVIGTPTNSTTNGSVNGVQHELGFREGVVMDVQN